MKLITGFGTTLLGIIFATSLSAHHAALGIISDDIWNMIDDNLTLAESPHIYIDFDNVMGSMRVSEDPEDGSMFLLTSITVRVDDAEDYMNVIEEVMNQILTNPGQDSRIPEGITSSGKSMSLVWDLVDLGDGLVEIILQEPIGASGVGLETARSGRR